ncbi:U4/U6.U5 tri-snRNP-associated protein 2 isoform X2 [Ammospiza nelsoni]|uniref:U4/U6.U5 tri-snRNP-associated protein 2 isoform X2 n=1 Tax=Ammospiza nelsoni TaxID=2857394 RepID=UPI00286B7709|nr:U4/U6.U5 tri-snRNP-associated protein 2 isoform X2 [Ammospiza nelsoni]
METPTLSPSPPCVMGASTPRTSAAGTAPTWTPSTRACWTSTSRSSAPSPCPTSTSTPASSVGNTSRRAAEPPRVPQPAHAQVLLPARQLRDHRLLPRGHHGLRVPPQYVLKPTFTAQHIAHLDKQAKLSRAYDGTTYLPGIVGLNNIKANDYANAVLQALSNVPPLRNYFLEEENYRRIQRPPGDIMFLLVQRFGELMRKLWNPRNFKAHVSPHEMLQAVVLCSKKNFQITKQGDGVEFLSWFLNALHAALGGTKRKKKTIVTDVFQGSMRIFTKKLPHPDLPAEEKAQLLQNSEYQERMVESTFLYLTLDLPTAPLYKDEKEQLIIPQVPLFSILAKFNGSTEKEYKTYKENFLKRFQLTRLPPYLIFCIKRFTKNNFFVEKNPTIVNFPITNVDLREYLSEEVQAAHSHTTYDLIANIVHDGKPSEGSYRIHVLHHGTGKWYELQDLQVTDILPQMITLSEAYIQIWKRREEDETNQQQGA